MKWMKGFFHRKKVADAKGEDPIFDNEDLMDDPSERSPMKKQADTYAKDTSRKGYDGKSSGIYEDSLDNELMDEEESDEEEYEVVEREILPEKIICPDCGGITLQGLEFCDKCGGEL